MHADYDSLLTHTPLSPLQQTAEYTNGRYIPDGDVAGQLRVATQATDQWVVMGIVVMVVVLCLVLASHLDYIAYRVKDFFSTERKFSNVPQQTTVNEVTMLVVTAFVGCLSLSLLGFDQFKDQTLFRHNLPDMRWLYLVLAAIPLLWVLLKAVIYRLVDWVFFDRTSSRKWMESYYFLTALFLGLMLPVAIVYLFTDVSPFAVSNCILTLLILYELLLLFKLITNFPTKLSGKMLIFLYFYTPKEKLQTKRLDIQWKIIFLTSD